jgi:hypothetical protein
VETLRSALPVAGDEAAETARAGLVRIAVNERRGLVVHAIDTLQETIDMEAMASGRVARLFLVHQFILLRHSLLQ